MDMLVLDTLPWVVIHRGVMCMELGGNRAAGILKKTCMGMGRRHEPSVLDYSHLSQSDPWCLSA